MQLKLCIQNFIKVISKHSAIQRCTNDKSVNLMFAWFPGHLLKATETDKCLWYSPGWKEDGLMNSSIQDNISTQGVNHLKVLKESTSQYSPLTPFKVFCVSKCKNASSKAWAIKTTLLIALLIHQTLEQVLMLKMNVVLANGREKESSGSQKE